jgi:3-deoxy-7-phosphoheptulonate synthase
MENMMSLKLVGREHQIEDTQVRVGSHVIAGDRFTLIAGPCAVESKEQLMQVAKAIKLEGAQMLRGGAYKPRTSPYSFQGLGEQALNLLKQAEQSYQLPTVSEIIDVKHLATMSEQVSMLQVGARNMQNFELLKALGKTNKPILLKRGMSATIEELLNAAEYILAAGNRQVVLCERGIRTFETATRNTLDLGAVAYLKQVTHLPVIVDPSHATGIRELIIPLAKAAVAVGADGIIVEVHPEPAKALSDAQQQLDLNQFKSLVMQLKPFIAATGRVCA